MPISASPPPTHHTPVALARGFLTGAVIGASPAAFVVGIVTDRPPLVVAGVALPVVYGLLFYLAGAPRRAREAAVEPRTALAMIESLRAGGSETGDIPVRFDLTVVPDDGPAFRVGINQAVNLVDLPAYRPRDVLVVQYPPDRPWDGSVVKRPTPEWQDRAASARLDSAPESTVVSEPPEGCGFGVVVLLGILVGAAAAVLPFRADLFDRQPAADRPAPANTSLSSTRSTTLTSVSGTVSVGPGQSLLDQGALRPAVDSLTKDRETHQAITLAVQDRMLSVVFAPPGTESFRFDVDSLPYERFPALVAEAGTTLGVRSPQAWQITVAGIAGPVTIKVSVTGPEGTAALEADVRGNVVRRTPAR
ncbi:hypothetical protein [Streptomyces sp. NRRL S-350]|uniref:hypothetical protein n=1 Tax=Streptomyces sp. NRRL S-350 TaxID=1463902 RepID=UPI0004C16509|nr:hypothetical protein [Streptomyces sp. NRRL S-350]